MHEENKNGTTEETPSRSVFGVVLGRFMEARGMPADPEHVSALAERSGLDPADFLARVTGETTQHVASWAAW